MLPRKVKLFAGVEASCVLLVQKRCMYGVLVCWCAVRSAQCVSLLASLRLGRTSIQDKLLRNVRTINTVLRTYLDKKVLCLRVVSNLISIPPLRTIRKNIDLNCVDYICNILCT